MEPLTTNINLLLPDDKVGIQSRKFQDLRANEFKIIFDRLNVMVNSSYPLSELTIVELTGNFGLLETKVSDLSNYLKLSNKETIQLLEQEEGQAILSELIKQKLSEEKEYIPYFDPKAVIHSRILEERYLQQKEKTEKLYNHFVQTKEILAPIIPRANTERLGKLTPQTIDNLQIDPSGKKYLIYKEGEQVGFGGQKQVYLACCLRDLIFGAFGKITLHPDENIPVEKITENIQETLSQLKREVEFHSILTEDCFLRLYHTVSYTSKSKTYANGEPVIKIGLMTEYCNGETLFELINKYPSAKSEDLWQILEDCFTALKIMAERGIHHCDIKPENIFLTIDEQGRYRAKIGDFGFSKYVKEEVNNPALDGTPVYFSPQYVNATENIQQAFQDQYQNGIFLCNNAKLEKIEFCKLEKQLVIMKNTLIADRHLLKEMENETSINPEFYSSLTSKIEELNANILLKEKEMEELKISYRKNYQQGISEQRSARDILLKNAPLAASVKNDLWAFGIILLIMRNNFPSFLQPVEADRDIHIKNNRSIAEHDIDAAFSKNIVPGSLEELNRRLLNVNCEEIPSAEECLRIIKDLKAKNAPFV